MLKNIHIKIFILSGLVLGLSFYYFYYLPRHATQQTPESALPTISLVTEIHNSNDFEQLLKDDMPVIIKFYAPWCGACQYVDHYFSTLATMFENTVHFYQINTDNADVMNLIQESHYIKESINYLPTFVLIQGNQTYKQFQGAKEMHELQQEIQNTFTLPLSS